MKNIVLTGGGTAGHITPNLSLIPYLKNDFNNIYYFGSKNSMEEKLIKDFNIPFYSVPCAKLVRSFTLKNLTLPLTVIRGVKKAKTLLKKLNVSIVFSKGGYVSVPVVIAASKLNIPVISHESDYTLGLANRFTAKFCKVVLTSFKDTANTISNGKFIGPPIRENILSQNKSASFNFFGFNGKKPILLVTGGSLGAKPINDALIIALPTLLEKYDIIHITGKGKSSKIKQQGYYPVEYLNCMEKALAVADVCVSRSGSNTVFELLAKKIPSVLIPLSNSSSRGDQVLNAHYFLKKGLVFVIDEKDLTANSLVAQINGAYNSREFIKAQLTKNPVENATPKIYKTILNYTR